MDMKSLSIVDVANRKLSYLNERQKVIAANVANANTPNYLVQDVEEPDFAAQVNAAANRRMEMLTTNEKHIASVQRDSGRFKIYTPEPDTALTIDGNGVVLEDQLNEASKVRSEYDRILTIYNKYKTMLQTANTKINT